VACESWQLLSEKFARHRCGIFPLQVQAVDDGPSPRTGMAQVTVDVTNVNDNVPIISDPAGEC